MTPAPHPRQGAATVRLTDATGAPAAHEPVLVEQRSHAFGFGCTAFELIPGGAAADPAHTAREAAQWLAVFNRATLPLYWRWFETVPGRPDTHRIAATARWLRGHGVRVKGHPLLWHTLAPEWLLGRSERDVENTVRARIARDAAAFSGIIEEFDAINEAVILPVFTAEDNAITELAKARGRVEVVRLAFETARAANPSARLVLNDFNLSAEYEHLIEECLAAGIEIDALGLQTHMHQGYRGAEQVTEILDRFGRFGLPLQLTETSLVSGALMPAEIVDLNDYVVDAWPSTPEGEERQARELEAHYRAVWDHPAVESITWWGLQDRGQWLDAPAGLIRADGTPKPSYDVLRDLVTREWWHGPAAAVTDADGNLRIEGAAGEYRVTWSGGEVDVDVAGTAAQHAAGATAVETAGATASARG